MRKTQRLHSARSTARSREASPLASRAWALQISSACSRPRSITTAQSERPSGASTARRSACRPSRAGRRGLRLGSGRRPAALRRNISHSVRAGSPTTQLRARGMHACRAIYGRQRNRRGVTPHPMYTGGGRRHQPRGGRLLDHRAPPCHVAKPMTANARSAIAPIVRQRTEKAPAHMRRDRPEPDRANSGSLGRRAQTGSRSGLLVDVSRRRRAAPSL